jgi:hypothetical protein
MSAIEIASLIASFFSVGIALMAIWLSIVFYRMTTGLSVSVRDAAKDIGASVERLETLFSKLYADTFSMMRDTVTEMQKHVWPEKSDSVEKISVEAEKRADEKVKTLKADVDIEVTRLLAKQSKTDAKVDTIKGELEKIVSRVIDQSRKVETEARAETIRERILNILKSTKDIPIRADTIVQGLPKKYPEINPSRVVDEIRKMKVDGIISWEDKTLGPDTEIVFKS